jgi:soluble lytic murein transglycosylase-like protein
MSWIDNGAPWLALLNAAEDAHSIPHNLLTRIAYQECRWRHEIINGTLKSPAGAVGMMQLMPQFFPNAGVSIAADITTAATLLASQYTRFKDWQLAVAAYNWGGGNVHHWLQNGGPMPLETTDYVAQVYADIPIDGGIMHA